MKRIITTLFIGILISSPCFAKSESSSRDAASVVLYGNNNGSIVPIKVDADGIIDVSGGGNSFETIAVPAGASVVADASTDTLTITETSPLVITGTAATDTIAITWSGTDIDSAGAVTADSVALTTDTTGNYAAGDAEAGNVAADKVLESSLKAVDAAADEECLTYETTTGDFEWQACGSGGGDSITVAGVAATDPNFIAGGITWTLDTAATPDTIVGTVATNANLTGEVTSVGNAAVLGSFTSAAFVTAVTGETGTGAVVLGTDPALTAPAVSGTPNAAGELGYNTTQAMQTTYGGITAIVAPIHGTIATGVGTETLTNSVATDQDFTSMYTFPANSIYTNKVYRVTVLVEAVTGVSTATLTHYLKIGGTKVYTQSTDNISNSTTTSWSYSFLIFGRAAAGASANVSTAFLSPNIATSIPKNLTDQPVALATNGTLTVIFGIAYSATGSTETVEQQGFLIEELN